MTGVWNQLSLLGFPAIALALLTTANEAHPCQTASLVGLVVFVAVGARSRAGCAPRGSPALGGQPRCTPRDPRAALDPPWTGQLGRRLVRRLQRAPVELLRRRWHVLTLATLAGQLTVFVLFFVCLRVLEVLGREVWLDRGVRGLVARAPARLDPAHAGGLGVVELG